MPLSQYAYATDEKNLTIRLRTAKNDVESCRVFFGDRVAMEEPIPVCGVNMEKCASDDLFDYYEALIETDYTRVCYYFCLTSGEEKQYYYSRGFCSQMKAHRTEYFQFPYIRREEVIKEPDWVAGSVMYHIFPDSFANGEKSLQLSSKTFEKSGNKLGGNLRGVTGNLDYLKELGINLLYLNPIFKANSYHKYDTIDYFDIDPCLGTKQEFKELVDQAHERGMRIILDGVFNHCGPDFFAFQDVLKKGEKSEYCDWFYKLRFPVEYKDPPNYECFAYVKEMPKLNTGNPKVREFICEVGRYWIREFGIDGWRLDVANEVDHETWRAFREAVRKEDPKTFLIAEIWEDADVWLKGDQFDSAMNYTFTYLCRDFFAKGAITAEEFDEQMQKAFMRYPWPVANAQMNFLDSHDVPRFLHYCGGDVKRMELAFFYLMMAPGIPSVFYGDECFLTGSTEEEYRSPMAWDGVKNEFAGKLGRWIALRKEHEALTRGTYRREYVSNEGVYIFSRTYGEEKIYIMINNSDREEALPEGSIFKSHDTIMNLSDGNKWDLARRIPPFSGLIIKKQNMEENNEIQEGISKTIVCSFGSGDGAYADDSLCG